MIVTADRGKGESSCYQGLRMTAAEYLQLPADGLRYELIDGVIIMSPSPSYRHQKVAAEVLTQIAIHLRDEPCGDVLAEVDVHLGDEDLVYRPDIVFVSTERVPKGSDHIQGPPDLIVEIVSDSSRRYDYETKKRDYERFGVGEYWIIDPDRDAVTILRLCGGEYQTESTDGVIYRSQLIPGFRLDIDRIRKCFRPGGPEKRS